MFTALAVFAVAAAMAVGVGATPAGRRVLARWMEPKEERVGLHRLGSSRKKAEAYNRRRQLLGQLEAAWTGLGPAAQQVRLVVNSPQW